MLFSNALIGLREGLEAALVVVILVAFLVKTERRWALRWVWAGVAAAIAMAVAIGAILTFGTQTLTFEAQEMIGGGASIIAVAFVTVMIFWMRTASRTISGELKGRLTDALEKEGAKGALAIAFVGFLGVGREGLETAIFFYATTEAAGAGNSQPMIGWALGLGTAILMGWLIYKGALKINLSKFFKWTGALLVLVAAGILGYGIHDLQEARVLPGLNSLAFDVSNVIDPSSWYAALLKGILNFTPATTWLQFIAWILYVAIVLPLFLRPVRVEPKGDSTSTTANRTAAPATAGSASPARTSRAAEPVKENA